MHVLFGFLFHLALKPLMLISFSDFKIFLFLEGFMKGVGVCLLDVFFFAFFLFFWLCVFFSCFEFFIL